MERAGIMQCCPAACALITPPLVGYFIEVAIYMVTASPDEYYGSATNTGINMSGLLVAIGGAVAAYFGLTKRKQMAQKYNLQMEDDLKEFCCWFCCECCTIIQEYRTIMKNVDATGNWGGMAMQPGAQVQVTVIGAQQPAPIQAAAPVAAATADVPDKVAEAAPPGGGAEGATEGAAVPPAYGVAAPPAAARTCC
jgi:Cys-rich protein (TIGR01571 family)